jgi:hypothetical protein
MRGVLGLLFGLTILLTGCRKELCYGHEEHAPGMYLNVKAEWEQAWERDYGCDWLNNWRSEWGIAYDSFIPGIPEGLRLYTYVGDKPQQMFNLRPEGGKAVLDKEGVYSLLFHNNNTEYIVYDGLNVSTRATATTRTVTRSGFRALHEGERIINQPDMLYGKYIEEYWAEEKVGAELLEITMRPLVYTYYIRFEFEEGIEHVVKACGSIAGMAEKVYLHDGHTGEEAATVLYDCQLGQTYVDANVMTFGVPNYPGDHYNRMKSEMLPYRVGLELLLANGQTESFDFDIAEQMEKQPRGGVIVVKGIKVEMEIVEGGGGGFDVNVNDWGNVIVVPLPI